MIQRNQIWKLYGTKYLEMTKRLLEETDLASLIGSREKRIGIKPNLVVPSPAEYGGTTHPEVVAGIVEYLQDNGFTNILIVVILGWRPHLGSLQILRVQGYLQ